MILQDRIYGEFNIFEPILIELISSKTLERLKEISQNGVPDEYYHKKGFSRYEHSIGVMLLLRKLGASLNEQIAGLLHDASHTAFSHVIDWVIGDPTKESYQDDSFIDYIKKSDIPSILSKYNLDYKIICDLEKYTLLENELPNICADRVDYSLREIIEFEEKEKFNEIISNLLAYQGTIIFKDINSAELFALNYALCQKEHWAGVEAKARYYIFSKLLRTCLNKKIINMSDFWKTDKEVMNLIDQSNDVDILSMLRMLKNGFYIKSSNKENGVLLNKKVRYVDPLILSNGNLKKLSEVSQSYFRSLELQKKDNSLDKYIEVVAK